jgi:hypothetical protein
MTGTLVLRRALPAYPLPCQTVELARAGGDDKPVYEGRATGRGVGYTGMAHAAGEQGLGSVHDSRDEGERGVGIDRAGTAVPRMGSSHVAAGTAACNLLSGVE